MAKYKDEWVSYSTDRIEKFDIAQSKRAHEKRAFFRLKKVHDELNQTLNKSTETELKEKQDNNIVNVKKEAIQSLEDELPHDIYVRCLNDDINMAYIKNKRCEVLNINGFAKIFFNSKGKIYKIEVYKNLLKKARCMTVMNAWFREKSNEILVDFK